MHQRSHNQDEPLSVVERSLKATTHLHHFMHINSCYPEGKIHIGDHVLPQRGFGISTPSGAEREGTTPSNTRRKLQHESRQRAMHEPRSEHTRTRRHSVFRQRSPNQENKGSKSGANSITLGAGTATQGERIQEPGHATRVNRVCIIRAHMKQQKNASASGRRRQQKVPTVGPRSVGSAQPRGEALQLKK
jgi:hypothetical protein